MVLVVFALAAIAVTLPAALVALLGGTVIPMLVALIAHSNAPPGVKRLLAGLLALAPAAIANGAVADGSSIVELSTLLLAVAAFVWQQLTYTSFWKRLNLNRWRWLLPDRGIGKPPDRGIGKPPEVP